MSTRKTEALPFEPIAEPPVDGDGPRRVDSAVQGAIGRKLRETYDEVVKEEVPDRLLKLLDDLKKREQDKEKGDV